MACTALSIPRLNGEVSPLSCLLTAIWNDFTTSAEAVYSSLVSSAPASTQRAASVSSCTASLTVNGFLPSAVAGIKCCNVRAAEADVSAVASDAVRVVDAGTSVSCS
eukprot:2443830-Prymnesium_polylepis.1